MEPNVNEFADAKQISLLSIALAVDLLIDVEYGVKRKKSPI